MTRSKITLAKIITFLYLVVTGIYSFAAADEKVVCTAGQNHSIEWSPGTNGSIASQHSLCVGERPSLIWSISCAQHKCQAWQKLNGRHLHADIGYSMRGTPGSRLCVQAGGWHQLVKYKVQNKWIENGLCLFDDNSYVSDSQAAVIQH